MDRSSRRRAPARAAAPLRPRDTAEAPPLTPVLIDTGVLYALVDRSDDWHVRAREYIQTCRPTLLAPVTVIPEAVHLVRTRVGEAAERTFIRSFADREIAIEALRDADVARALTLMEHYPDLGFTDCSLVAIAERLALTTIATTDRRHFAGVRPKHRSHFTLVP